MRYPVYVISKGRPFCMTSRWMRKDGMDHRVVIEPQQRAEYAEQVPEELLMDLPFSELGQGSIPARNWCMEHSIQEGHARHWIVDDNCQGFWRWHDGRRLHCDGGYGMGAMEDFVDRYTNVALAGPNYLMFGVGAGAPPFRLNVHVYSCILVDNSIPHRWRGRYNEDTDLCLQVLSAGLCTVLFNAFLVEKRMTGTMKGGNAEELYQGDGRLRMARSLERAWPGIVTVDRRFRRPQHIVNWARFDTPLQRRPDLDWDAIRQQQYPASLVRTGPQRRRPTITPGAPTGE